MIRNCAWHPLYFGVVKQMGVIEPVENTDVSHGICDECLPRAITVASIQRKRELLDKNFEAFMRISHG